MEGIPVSVNSPDGPGDRSRDFRQIFLRMISNAGTVECDNAWLSAADEIIREQRGEELTAAARQCLRKGYCISRRKGDTITRIQTAPNGEKSETEWGRIELDNKANPKSIDIFKPDSPSDRLLGIYDIKDGTLRICFAEQSTIDIARGRTVNRPTTFDAPAGSEMVLLECQGAVEDPEVKQLQGVWEAASVTEGGKQLTAKKDFGSVFLEINGYSFAITETSLNGMKSDPDTGRIEINSTTIPKTIDFIDRNHRDRRSLGIYELKEGVLRICMAETSGNDSPPGERIPEVKPTQRPSTFDSPTGSNIMLIEFQQKQLEKSAHSSNDNGDPTVQVTRHASDFDELDKELFSTPRGRRTVAQMYMKNPELQKSTAERFVAEGKLEAAKRILALLVPPDPEAIASLELAKLLENQGQIQEAADAYLKAYRIFPALLDEEHVSTIMKSGRAKQLVDVFTADRLRKLNFINDVAATVKLLLNNESTVYEGYRLFRQEWSASDRNHFNWLRGDKKIWSEIPDPEFYIRSKLLPSDFAAEGDG